MPTLIKSRTFKSLLLGILVVCIGLLVEIIAPGRDIDSRTSLDALFHLRGKQPAPQEVVVVAIDKVASAFYGLPNTPAKWPRDYHARLIRQLHQAGVKAIIFDLYFKSPGNPEQDRALQKAIAAANNVVLFARLEREILTTTGDVPRTLKMKNVLSVERIYPPIPLLADAAMALAPFTLPKFPAQVTRFWTFRSTAGDKPTLPVVALFKYLQQDLQQLDSSWFKHYGMPSHQPLMEYIMQFREILANNPTALQAFTTLLKQSSLPPKHKLALLNVLTGSQQPYLNFYGPPRSITTLTYNQVLENQLPAGFSFRNKVVFIGFSEKLEPEQKDNFNTVFSQANGLDISGVEIAATAFANLLHSNTLKPLDYDKGLILIVVFGLLVSMFSRLFRFYLAIPLWFILCSGYIYLAYIIFKNEFIWLPLFVPILVQAPLALVLGMAWHTLDNYRARQYIHKAFSQYIPKKVVDELSTHHGQVQHTQQLQYGVCLATDAEQYTQLAETTPPEILTRLMNNYYETLFAAVRSHQGIISDVIGDAMLALWLSEQASTENYIQACLAAIQIKQSIHKRYSLDNHYICLPTRMGLHAGQIMMGNVGAMDHYEYRAVGDIVNTTNRIESLNKHLGTHLLASQQVLQQTEQFLCREMGHFRLAGKQQAVTLYEIIDIEAHASDDDKRLCEQFNDALSLFKQANFMAALSAFSDICKQIPTDGPANFYLQQCNQQRKISDQHDWDAIINIPQK